MRKRHWLSLLTALLLGMACSDDGTTTSCDEMPVDEDLSQSPEVEQWWEEAAKEGCATPRGERRVSGAAGAPND